jgi:hypothetical protein
VRIPVKNEGFKEIFFICLLLSSDVEAVDDCAKLRELESTNPPIKIDPNFNISTVTLSYEEIV